MHRQRKHIRTETEHECSQQLWLHQASRNTSSLQWNGQTNVLNQCKGIVFGHNEEDGSIQFTAVQMDLDDIMPREGRHVPLHLHEVLRGGRVTGQKAQSPWG